MNYTAAQSTLTVIARILFSLIFILSAVNKITAFDSTVTYMIGAGISFHPNILAIVATVFELTGGILLLLGWYTRFAAALLFVFTLAVTFSIHHFWSYPAIAAQIQMINFMKNLAMLGGILYIFSFGAGSYSIDGLRARRRKY